MNYQYWMDKGLVCYRENRIEDAAECFQSALDIDGSVPILHLFMGLCRGIQGRHEEAVQYSRKARILRSDMVEAWQQEGESLKVLKRFGEAVECFNKAVELDPESENLWYWLGECLESLELFDEALKAFQEAIRINHEDVMAWFHLGQILAFT